MWAWTAKWVKEAGFVIWKKKTHNIQVIFAISLVWKKRHQMGGSLMHSVGSQHMHAIAQGYGVGAWNCELKWGEFRGVLFW